MRKIILTNILFLCAATAIHAQSTGTGKITVKIADAAGNPLPYASVAVRKASDTSLVKGQMSDADGNCLFDKVAYGAYFVQVSQMGYTMQKSDVFQLNASSQHANLKTLTLQSAPKSLQTVNVTAQKPYIERAEGKTILNVESSVAAAGNTVLDLLRRAPGVTVDKDDNLLIKGKQGVTVMLDGKLTYLSNEALAELLKSMSAENVSQIEIITSPSAKYDAAGTSGIINIKTKKGQMLGMNGTVNLSAGGEKYGFYSMGLSLNWRTRHFNVFGNLNHGDRQFYATRKLYRKTGGDTPLDFEQGIYQKGDFMNRSFKVGMDYYITPNHTVGVMVNGYSNAFWREQPSATSIANRNSSIDSILYSAVYGNNRFRNTSVNLNYKFKIDTSGSELTMDADYAKFYNRMYTTLFDSLTDVHSGTTRNHNGVRTLPYTNIEIKSAKVDWVQTLNKSTKIEAGLKVSSVNTGNNMQYDSLRNGAYEPIPSQYDQFIYKEDILAGYFSYKKQLKKMDFVLGMRLEQTTSDGNSVSLNNRVKRTYLDFFPNLSADYKFTENNKLGIAYTKRINRPGYGQLNPFLFFLDKYTFFRGSPFLIPEYTHNTALTYTFKQKYLATLGYSQTNNVINEYLYIDKTTKGTISTNRNLGVQRTYTLNLTLPFDPVKWWNTSNNVSIYYNKYNIRDTVKDFSTEKLTWNFNTTNTFTLPKDIKIELSGWFNAPNVYGIWVSKAMWAMNAGVQKTVLNKKGTVKLNVNDIFKSIRFQGVASYNDVYLAVDNKWVNRSINLSFSYRFGNTKIEAARERQTGNVDESRRAGN